MKKAKVTNTANTQRKIRPSLTPEAEENQMISLAVNLVKQRLIDGTASAQETVHYLKLASSMQLNYEFDRQLELERAELENKLIKAKTQVINDQADMKTLYKDAIDAMRRYSGHDSESEEDEIDGY